MLCKEILLDKISIMPTQHANISIHLLCKSLYKKWDVVLKTSLFKKQFCKLDLIIEIKIAAQSFAKETVVNFLKQCYGDA
jgi:hypothetical protein